MVPFEQWHHFSNYGNERELKGLGGAAGRGLFLIEM